METTLLTLKNVASILNVKPYRINYVLATKLVPEPASRFGNKRIFTQQDLQRLRDHFSAKRGPTTVSRDKEHDQESQTEVCATG
jgi:hypothetical protein